ncbi:unnamed protein product [Somion occarium]|uniref:Uncharacterized protein n=1 Tax=Somion occarium TaxID=3059160 RepID=A0ABP1DLR8_9APHY
MPLFKSKTKHADDARLAEERDNAGNNNQTQTSNNNKDLGNNNYDAGNQQGRGQSFGSNNPSQGQRETGPEAKIGSSALREHGLLREREAEVLHAQSQELAEAERLEQSALEHRERAVAVGADPANKALGGGSA